MAFSQWNGDTIKAGVAGDGPYYQPPKYNGDSLGGNGIIIQWYKFEAIQGVTPITWTATDPNAAYPFGGGAYTNTIVAATWFVATE